MIRVRVFVVNKNLDNPIWENMPILPNIGDSFDESFFERDGISEKDYQMVVENMRTHEDFRVYDILWSRDKVGVFANIYLAFSIPDSV